MKFLIYPLIIFSIIGVSHAQRHHEITEQGSMQSPININTSEITTEANHILNLHYNPSTEHIKHGEHSVTLDYDPGSYIIFDDEQYDFLQFHFHTPSEHHLDNQEFPLEMHMVHMKKDSIPRYLVIGILYEEGHENPFIKNFIGVVPEEVRKADFPFLKVDVSEELLPRDLGSYYQYDGSLTTPPFTETVEWVITSKIHQASRAQIQRLIELEGTNNREIQSLNNRVVQECHSRMVTYKF